MAYIDTSKVTIPKGFFEDLNVPKLLDWLNSQPTADVVEVKYGEWIEDSLVDGASICSLCGNTNYRFNYDTNDWGSNFCSNCGAKMDGERRDT